MNTYEAVARYGKWAVDAGTAAIVRLDEKPGISPSQAAAYVNRRKINDTDSGWNNLPYRKETIRAIANRSKSRGT